MWAPGGNPAAANRSPSEPDGSTICIPSGSTVSADVVPRTSTRYRRESGAQPIRLPRMSTGIAVVAVLPVRTSYRTAENATRPLSLLMAA